MTTKIARAPASAISMDQRDLMKLIRQEAKLMTRVQARYLVDTYYQVQEFRKAAGNQTAALVKSNEPAALTSWVHDEMEGIEKTIAGLLKNFADSEQSGMGRWAQGIMGIGPVISAGLIAHIDIEQAPTAGHIWRFAGLDPTTTWGKGEKRPWNAGLKVLCWKIGESFVKVKGRDDDYYGHLYEVRKAYEAEKNEKGEYADQAARGAERVKKSTEAYKFYAQGKLPPGHLHSRAKRWAVKLFIAHWHAEAYRRHYHQEPPLPYALTHLGHAHIIPPPHVNVD